MLLANQSQETMSPTVGTIVGVILFWLVIICLIIYGVKRKKYLAQMEQNKEEGKERLKSSGLVETKKMEGEDYSIIVDDENQKFAIRLGEQSQYSIYEYDKFIDCEVIETDGTESKTSGSAGKVIAGGLFLGELGALAGLSGGRKTKLVKIIYALSVRILVEDIKTPFYQIDILDRQCKSSSDEYLDAVKEIGEIVATFNLIKKRNEKKSEH